jgi:hypothetical protein
LDASEGEKEYYEEGLDVYSISDELILMDFTFGYSFSREVIRLSNFRCWKETPTFTFSISFQFLC